MPQVFIKQLESSLRIYIDSPSITAYYKLPKSLLRNCVWYESIFQCRHIS